MKEGKQRRQARYYNTGGPLDTGNFNVLIVASINWLDWSPVDWAVYIGAAPPTLAEDKQEELVCTWGSKLSERDARYYFPELAAVEYRP